MNIRDFFLDGINTDLTQGSVFSGAYTEKYTDSSTFGLIITARCDLAQEKVGAYSYLPLVPYKDWLRIDFPELLYSAVHKSVYNQLVQSFQKLNGNERLLQTYSLKKIKEKFLINEKDKTILSKIQLSFLNCIEKYEIIESLLTTPHTNINNVITKFPKDSEKIFKNLISQNLAGNYLIDDVGGDGIHIIKLREVYHLKSSDALKLKKGIRLSSHITYKNDSDISYTVGEIRSPYIEHIMQKFSEIFTRIGIDDPSKILLSTLQGNV